MTTDQAEAVQTIRAAPSRWDEAKVYAVGALGAFILRTLFRTLRHQCFGYRELETPKVIYAFWHGRQLMMSEFFRYYRHPHFAEVCVLISAHRDGRMIASAVKRLGIQSVAGSSSRGGRAAFRGLLRAAEDGFSPAITPDGPRGPLYEVKEGVIRLAQATGLPIVVCAYGAERSWKFRSWDRMILPKPFSRAVVKVGEPLYVEREASAERIAELQLELKKRLDDVTEGCDRHEYR